MKFVSVHDELGDEILLNLDNVTVINKRLGLVVTNSATDPVLTLESGEDIDIILDAIRSYKTGEILK